MNQRLPANKNLTLHVAPIFNGYPVNLRHGPLIREYLQRSLNVIQTALAYHPRTFVIGMTLRAPAGLSVMPDDAISRFIESLKAQITADRLKAARTNQRVHQTGVRYLWAKERDTSQFHHYHVLLFLNADTYRALGNKQADDGNMATRIIKAWATALMLYPHQTRDAVHFSGQKCVTTQNIPELMYWASYSCKVKTKEYSGGGKCFGYSQK